MITILRNIKNLNKYTKNTWIKSYGPTYFELSANITDNLKTQLHDEGEQLQYTLSDIDDSFNDQLTWNMTDDDDNSTDHS